MSIHLQRKYKINNILEKKFIVNDFFTDEKLIELMNNLFDYYKNNGSFHFKDEQDYVIIRIYYDRMLEKIIDDVEIELNEDDQEILIAHIENIYG